MPGRPHKIEILARKVARRREFKPGIRDDPMIPAAISALEVIGPNLPSINRYADFSLSSIWPISCRKLALAESWVTGFRAGNPRGGIQSIEYEMPLAV
jgi:hypothetical protein